jgi:hypothetical protein
MWEGHPCRGEGRGGGVPKECWEEENSQVPAFLRSH